MHSEVSRLATQGGRFEKKRPKNIMFDQEALYDSTVHLKESAMLLQEENKRAQEDAQQLEVISREQHK